MKIQKNIKLKIAIIESGMLSKEVAKKAKINTSWLSMACSGRIILKDDEKKRISEILDKNVEDLFESN